MAMSHDDLKHWRDETMRWRQEDAARELDLSRRMYQLYEDGSHPIPRRVELSCMALQHGHTAFRRIATSSLPRGYRSTMRDGA
jgi:hypothetical protein